MADIFKYIPGDNKEFGTLIVTLPGKKPIHIYTMNHNDVERHMYEIIKYYETVLSDIVNSSNDVLKTLKS